MAHIRTSFYSAYTYVAVDCTKSRISESYSPFLTDSFQNFTNFEYDRFCKCFFLMRFLFAQFCIRSERFRFQFSHNLAFANAAEWRGRGGGREGEREVVGEGRGRKGRGREGRGGDGGEGTEGRRGEWGKQGKGDRKGGLNGLFSHSSAWPGTACNI